MKSGNTGKRGLKKLNAPSGAVLTEEDDIHYGKPLR
jgi:hypothetical protein